MKILPITYLDKVNFKSKKTLNSDYFDPKNLEQKLKKINENNASKEIFIVLSMLSNFIIAEFSIFAAENTEVKKIIHKIAKKFGFETDKNMFSKLVNVFFSQQKNLINKEPAPYVQYGKLLEEKSERNKYLAITSYFPNLDIAYKDLLKKTVVEPENKENLNTLNSIEDIFNVLSRDEGLKYRKSYFEALDKNNECLDLIAKNFTSTLSNDETPMRYLVLLKNEKLSKSEMQKWAKYENLSCDEFMLLKNFNENIINNINLLKLTNKNFKITDISETQNAKYILNYIFKLDFKDNISLEEKLKAVSDIHKAIYGDIYAKVEEKQNDKYLKDDIKTELLDNIIKDNQIDPIFNFVKYINPNALKDIKLSSKEVKLLDKNSQIFKQIQSICLKELINLDFNSPKLVEFIELITNNDIFGNIITSRHAKVRFITRFVLKDNPNANLKKDCQEKIKILNEELNNEINKCNFYCFVNQKGTAPQFYIIGGELGNYVKITLNNQGNIHTIFEDFKKYKKQ